MSNDPLGIQPEGRAVPQHPEEEGGVQKPGKSSNGTGPKTKTWEELVNSSLPKRYSLARAEDAKGKEFFVWRGEDGAYCSPVMTDYDEALAFPQSNPLKVLTPEEVVELWEKVTK